MSVHNHRYLGEIPSGWTVARLDEVVSPNKPIVYGIVQAGPHVPDGVPYLKSTDVGSRIRISELSRTSPEIHQRYKRAEVTPGDVVFSLRGDIGQSSIVPPSLLTANLTQGTARISVSKQYSAEFIRYVLSAPLLKKRIAAIAKGSSFREVSLEQLRELEIPLPILSEQRKIAAILCLWDEAIEHTGQLIDLLNKQLGWIRTRLLSGAQRLPGFTAKWNTTPLRAVLTEHKLRSSGTEEVYSVSVHKGLINQIEHLGRSFSAKTTEHYNRVRPGDIVYTKSPTGEFPLGIVKRSSADKDVIVSPLYGVFTPSTPYIGIILDAWFESPTNIRNYLSPLVQKGAKNTIAITNKRFLEGRLALPVEVEEQSRLAALITTVSTETKIFQKQKKLLERQRRGLMQKLLTGEWRAPMPDGEEEQIAAHARGFVQ